MNMCGRWGTLRGTEPNIAPITTVGLIPRLRILSAFTWLGPGVTSVALLRLRAARERRVTSTAPHCEGEGRRCMGTTQSKCIGLAFAPLTPLFMSL
jgi:hypothetical protein